MDESNSSQLENPLGSFEDLRPSFTRQIKALFKKQLLQKIRRKSAIIEIIAAFLIILFNVISCTFSGNVTEANPDPAVQPYESTLGAWFRFPGTNVLLMPNNPKMLDLINHTTILKNYVYNGAKLQFVSSYSEIEDIIYATESNGMCIDWENINDEDALTNPVFKVYHQTSAARSPEVDLYKELKDAVVRMYFNDDEEKINKSYSISTEISDRPLPNSEKKLGMTGLSMNIGLFTAIPIVISSMPDFEKIFEEKENHVNALSFMMGMKESAYWFTNFISPLVINLVCYFMYAAVYCYGFALKGANFGLVLIVFFLYVFAETCFQFFVSTFMNKASNGRSLTGLLVVIALLFGILHQFISLDNSSHNDPLLHFFCIIPISALEVFVMQGYISWASSMPAFSFSNMSDRIYLCKPWIPLMWLAIDIPIYFFLFLIFNAVMPRPFGNPPLRLRELLTRKGWKKLAGKKSSGRQISGYQNVAVSVNNLTKCYDGSKINAIDDVSFEIERKEVIVMIGPNGAGKSTLINLIGGAIQPTAGEIHFGPGLDQHHLGVCFQDNVIIPELSVIEHFELFGAYRGIPIDVLHASIDYFATNMQLTHMLQNRAGDLSGGQKRKLCIGLSLLGNPAVVLMDEPTAGVDVQARQLIWKMIAGLKDTTSIITTHALEEAEAVSSRLFIVSSGTMPFTGTSTEMREKYRCGYVMRVDRDDHRVGPVLDFAKSFIPNTVLSNERTDTIEIPVDPKIPDFLTALDGKEKEFGINSYSFQVEQIEDVLVKLIQKSEVNNQ